MADQVIKVGEYIIIQKQNYKKIHKLNKPDSCVTLGRDSINLNGIEGYPYFSVFKMIPKGKKGREYHLEFTEETVDLKDEIDIKTSGLDNRNIVDDGQSQKLTSAEIKELTSDASKASNIVETLISNSNTFHTKTEFSQEKYLKKKEKKYFDYLQILRPNLRLIAEVMYRLDPGKVQGIRIDTLSQIMTLSNIQSEGHHLLYDSGSNGLLAAALMCAIGEETNGILVHIHPGNMFQKQALLAMNFNEEHYKRCISVNIYSVLRQIYQGCDTHNNPSESGNKPKLLKRKAKDEAEFKCKITKHDDSQEISHEIVVNTEMEANNAVHNIKDKAEHKYEIHKHDDSQEIAHEIVLNTKIEANNKVHNIEEITSVKVLEISKVNNSAFKELNSEGAIGNEANKEAPKQDAQEISCENASKTDVTNPQIEPKKPKWHFDNIAASELLLQKVDSLVIACKEDPQNIFHELMPFVKSGRPFVIYHTLAEPLQNLYMALKSNSNVGALKLTSNWMRNYQVLPERTHPEVLMNAQSGFLLTGYIFK